jgi:hypothetical protein
MNNFISSIVWLIGLALGLFLGPYVFELLYNWGIGTLFENAPHMNFFHAFMIFWMVKVLFTDVNVKTKDEE